LTVEQQRAGKADLVTIKVPPGTQIKKGDQYVYLPSLRENVASEVASI